MRTIVIRRIFHVLVPVAKDFPVLGKGSTLFDACSPLAELATRTRIGMRLAELPAVVGQIHAPVEAVKLLRIAKTGVALPYADA